MITGRVVRDGSGEPFAGVRVSDGIGVVTTDHDGVYELAADGPFVFVVRPTGWSTPRWYSRRDAGSHDFTLVPDEQPLPFSFVQITDIHVNGREVDPAGATSRLMNLTSASALEAFLRELPERAPDADFVVATGDLTNHGLDEEYAQLLAAFDTSPRPVYPAPGNHDHMNGVHEFLLSRHRYLVNTADPAAYERNLGPRWYSFDYGGVHFVVLDWHTWELGLDHEQQDAWLDADLAALDASSPWILLVHDQLPRSFFERLAHKPVATFSGHWHTSRVVDVDGVRHVNSPNTFFAGLDYSPPAFRSATWDGARLSLDSVTMGALTPSSARDARVRWAHPLDGTVLRARPVVVGDTVYVGASDDHHATGVVEAVDARDGSLRWRTSVAAPVKTTPVAVGEVLVVVDVRGDVHGVDRATGRTCWSAPTAEPLRHWGYASPATDGTLVFVGDQTCFRAIDAATGDVRWERDDLGPNMNLTSHAAPLLAAGVVVVGFWPLPPALVGLDPCTGKTVRVHQLTTKSALGGMSGPSPVGDLGLSLDGRHLYVPSGQGTACIDAATFELEWIAPAPGIFNPATPIATSHGVAVVLAEHGVRMLDPDDGRVRWAVAFEEVGPYPMACYGKDPHLLLAEPAVLRESLVLGALDGRVRVLAAASGEVLATVAVGVPIAAAPVVRGDSVIVVGVDGTLCSVDLAGMAS